LCAGTQDFNLPTHLTNDAPYGWVRHNTVLNLDSFPTRVRRDDSQRAWDNPTPTIIQTGQGFVRPSNGVRHAFFCVKVIGFHQAPPYPKTTKNTAIMNHRQISKAAAPRYITMISFSFISLLLFAQFTLVTFKGYQVVVLAEVVFNLIM
jgi:hypothetical protein